MPAISPRFRGELDWFAIGAWPLDGRASTHVRPPNAENYFVTECVNAKSTMRYSSPRGDRTRSLNHTRPRKSRNLRNTNRLYRRFGIPAAHAVHTVLAVLAAAIRKIGGSLFRRIRPMELKTGNSGIPKISDGVESP